MKKVNFLRLWLVAVAAVILTMICLQTKSKVVRTPLDNFSSPFVFGRFDIPEENPLTNEAFILGRRLFYDPILSGNNSISCSSCHLQHLAFTDGKTHSIGASGKPMVFNSMTLVNLLWGPQHFFWDGRSNSLEDQALIPIQHPDEMDQSMPELINELKENKEYRQLFALAYGDITSIHISQAIATFLRALVSQDSKYDRYLSGEVSLTEQEELGRKLFTAHPDVKVNLRGGNCIDCHSQFLTSGFKDKYDGFTNNGLDSDKDLREGLAKTTANPKHKGFFKTPTLRNIALTAPYMHDGRFKSLEEVLDHYDQGIKNSSTLSPLIKEANNTVKSNPQYISLHLTDNEKKAIIAFLHTLTDEDFVANTTFSNPL